MDKWLKDTIELTTSECVLLRSTFCFIFFKTCLKQWKCVRIYITFPVTMNVCFRLASHQQNFMARGRSRLPPPISGINYLQRFGTHFSWECSSLNSRHACSRSISVRTNCIFILHAIIKTFDILLCFSIPCILCSYARHRGLRQSKNKSRISRWNNWKR